MAQGNNLKTGDGTVFLNAEKAFNAIYVASGRGTVKLGQADALDKNSDYRGIYFTSRGDSGFKRVQPVVQEDRGN
ncbi:hypothetical protein MUTS15_04970 [Escherichia coli]|nr:hypothetical protein MUTS15_04970 [Escherichia coli]